MKCADCDKTAVGAFGNLTQADRAFCEDHAPGSVELRAGAVQKCPRCGERHEGIEAKAFIRPSALLRQWASCPTTREPIIIAHGSTKL